MEQHHGNPNQENSNILDRPSAKDNTYRPLFIRNLIPGIVIGVLLGFVIILLYQKHLPQVTQTLYKVTLISFGVLVLSFILVYAFKRRITTFIFGSATANSNEIIDDAQKITDVLTIRFADSLLSEVPIDVRQRIKFVLPRLMNWFIWNRFRNWWWQWVLGIFLSLGGLTGTLLLMNQNELLQNQNVLIQRQTSLEEANRRSALVVLMSNIFDKVDREIERQQFGLSNEEIDIRKYKLSQSLIGQIVALSHSFKPYRFMDGDTLIGKPLSPERGQLLITLSLLPLDSFTLHKIFQSATFQNSNLEGAILRRINLSSADLSGTNFKGADLRFSNLSKSKLINVDFKKSDLRNANLTDAILNESIFIDANLSEANLNRAFLIKANLTGADLIETKMSEVYLDTAILTGANLECANLHWINLVGANLVGANLGFTNLSDANLEGANLSNVKLVWPNLKRSSFIGTDLSGADLSGANLRGADLHDANLIGAKLFEVNFKMATNMVVKQLSLANTLYQCENLHDSLMLPLHNKHPHLFQEPQ